MSKLHCQNFLLSLSCLLLLHNQNLKTNNVNNLKFLVIFTSNLASNIWVMSYGFVADAMRLASRRNRRWYQENLVNVLNAAKEKHARDTDGQLVLAQQLMELLEEKVAQPTVVPPHDVIPSEDDSLMKPIEPEVLRILYAGTEKGASDKYLRERYKKSPEDKFFFRITSNWDYGWQQKHSRMRARDVNRGRCAILRDTFYRKNNLAPDPPHYAQPAGGEVTICSEYSCNFN